MKNETSKYVADWILRANEDLKTSEILLREGAMSNTICFHAQQAVEKYLKSFLARHEKHVRKTHDLEFLLDACIEVDNSFNELLEEARYLDQFYIAARYPADTPEFSMEEAKKAFAAANRIKDFVIKKISN
ncbi:MAG: HEPN domain-containing protein [bacterium]|nr:HEPN domain-containing protein [bacterium]